MSIVHNELVTVWYPIAKEKVIEHCFSILNIIKWQGQTPELAPYTTYITAMLSTRYQYLHFGITPVSSIDIYIYIQYIIVNPGYEEKKQ